jgi:two-component system cell cycle sensor histidine kinase/response regulator CckA
MDTSMDTAMDTPTDLSDYEALLERLAELETAQEVLITQQSVLERIATGAPLSEILEMIARTTEELSARARCSILLLDEDGRHLRHGAAPSLPESYYRAIDGVAIGPAAGSCGTAAYRSEPVIVADIASDPLWEPWREIALAHGLRACWSIPIISSKGTVLGTFAMYYGEPCAPDLHDWELVQIATYLAAIAIERARDEDELRRERRRYQELIETLDSIVWEGDARTLQFTFVSRQAERILGYPVERWLTEPTFWSDHLHPEDRRWAVDFCMRATAEKRPHTFEYRMIAADGRVVWLRDIVTVILENDEPVKLRGVMVDITQSKQQEAALEQERLRAAKLESLGVLAGGIAHDFNNFLAAIMGNLSLARLSVAPGTALDEALHEAEQACQRAAGLTRQLLAFAKGGAPVKKKVWLQAGVRESAELATRGSGVQCDVYLAPDLWPVEADEGQIGQVVHNLTLNARQAMPQGGRVVVRAENVLVQRGTDGFAWGLPLPDGPYVRIQVQDSGTGIAPEHLPKIFDPYFTTRAGGSGLGLAVVQGIVRRHDGHVAVHSTPGQGTTMSVYLPALPDSVGAALAPAREASEPAPVPGRGRILLMDDDAAVRSLVRRVLQRLGYEVAEAADGAEAVECYRQAHEAGRPFDAVIMDLTVPGRMGGLEAIRHLRELDPAVRAIVSSGYSDDPVMADYARYGFCGVLSKPYRAADLATVLAQVLVPSSAC